MLDLAIIPSVILLIFIYKMDKREKEPAKLLLGCFGFGVLSIIPALILELGIGAFVEEFFQEGSLIYAVIDGFVVAAFSEELFKYLFLKAKTWKSPEFNCTFDGIIYAVFVSLGFATFENIFYVIDGGISTAVMRMFTSVPGHACDAVFMGYFYSRAKQANVEGDIAAEKRNKRLALWVPVVLHGIYDCLISFEEDIVGEGVVILAILAWFAFVALQFVASFIIVMIASSKDKYFVPEEQLPIVETTPSFVLKPDYWICTCQTICKGNYCEECGTKRFD